MVPFPDDSDGDAMERVAATNDLSQPMLVDFAVVVPSALSAEEAAARANARGYATEVTHENEEWIVYCSVQMVLTHAELVRRQAELNDLVADLDGRSDGWGTLGNAAAAS